MGWGIAFQQHEPRNELSAFAHIWCANWPSWEMKLKSCIIAFAYKGKILRVTDNYITDPTKCVT